MARLAVALLHDFAELLNNIIDARSEGVNAKMGDIDTKLN